MLDKVIRLVTHRGFGITDHGGTFLLPRKTCQQVDISAEKHLIQIIVLAVDILVLPARIFGDLTIILVGISLLGNSLLSSLLKNLIFIITDLHGLDLGFLSNEGYRKD